jgi:hypothetical protein
VIVRFNDVGGTVQTKDNNPIKVPFHWALLSNIAEILKYLMDDAEEKSQISAGMA